MKPELYMSDHSMFFWRSKIFRLLSLL